MGTKATQKTGPNALFEFHAIKRRWVPAFSPFRKRQLKRKQLELDAFRHDPNYAFPNNKGNYAVKRVPKPAVPPLTPRERFQKLLDAYRDFARDLRRKAN